jgi:integration host factor subunit alpha
VTKADIIESVYEKVGFSKKEAADIVEMVFDTIKETLERGEKIKISARRVLTFRPSQVLKNALNASAEAAEAAAAAAAAAQAGSSTGSANEGPQ